MPAKVKPAREPKHPTIECPNCEGRGQVEIPPAYRAAYDELTHDWQTTMALLEKVPDVKGTALANRLTWLEEHGLAVARLCPSNFRVKEWRRT